jgi:hypothetical protein
VTAWPNALLHNSVEAGRKPARVHPNHGCPIDPGREPGRPNSSPQRRCRHLSDISFLIEVAAWRDVPLALLDMRGIE